MRRKRILFVLNNRAELVFFDWYAKSAIGVQLVHMQIKRYKALKLDVYVVNSYKEFVEVMRQEKLALAA